MFDESTFSVPNRYLSPRDCGPFHPDYAIMWNSDENENYLIICFTCREVKLISGSKSDIYEFDSYKMESWKELLAEFEVN
tara:strand:+ start:157 stop:396 length:240 start_codon:yes stop_codon:yes gene_type:complete